MFTGSASLTIGTRGSTYIFTAVFYGVDGAVVNPPSAALYVAYRVNGTLTQAIVAMVADSDFNWTANWDSNVADGGSADWHIRSAGSNKAALEGTIMLRVNLANPPSI